MNDEALSDFEIFAANYLKILTKENNLIPLLLNDYQRELLNLINEKREQNQPVRIIILKARQMGISTFCAAYLYWLTITNHYTKSKIIAHDDESTNNIFTIFKRYYELSPDYMRPMSRYSNRKELVFENPDDDARSSKPGLMSQMAVSTAGSRERAGRSSTLHHLHISEHAFWPDAALSTPALISAVSQDPKSTILIESTANGMDLEGKDFYDRVRKAEKHLSDFELFFIPWTANEGYKKHYSGFDFNQTEQNLKDIHKLSQEQIAWRRYTIENVFNGDEILFRQEFPISIDEAFIVSGTPYFDVEHIFALIKQLENKPVIKGNIVNNQFVEDKSGLITIYEQPQPNVIYVIGADVSEGLSHGDSSAACVLDRDLKQVAKLYGKIDPDQLGKALCDLGNYYNTAILCPEVNNMGHATLAEIKRLAYKRIYFREVYDEIAQKRMIKLGWNTTAQNKLLMLAEFKSAFKNKSLQINDVELLKEMTTVAFETASKVELNGKDMVVSACLAVQALTQAPQKNLYKAHNPVKTKNISMLEFLTKDKDVNFTYYD